jgi:large repetitive protein
LLLVSRASTNRRPDRAQLAGDHGELYIGVGSNTNAGVPSGIMGSGTMKENYFSGAVLVAHLGHPKFDAAIRYNATDDGDPIAGTGPTGVEVFGAGTRNPYGIWKHSNGNVYATDNGPNADYGSRSTGAFWRQCCVLGLLLLALVSCP